MKKRAGIPALILFIIIPLFFYGCATSASGEADTEVSFVSSADEAASAESEDTGDEVVNEPVADEADTETELPMAGEAPLLPEPATVESQPAEPVPEPEVPVESETTAEPELPVTADTLPAEASDTADAGSGKAEAPVVEEPWIEYVPDLKEVVTGGIQLPGDIEIIYNTAVPVIIPCTEETSNWSVILYYWPEGASTATGVRFERENDRFIGTVRTDYLPGERIYYLFRVEVPGETGGRFDFPGGPLTVQNDGPSSFSKDFIAGNFFYQPLFDLEKPGDSPGARRRSHGWEFRELYLTGDIKRWSCRILYRRKNSADTWTAYDTGGIHRNTDAGGLVKIPYNLPLKNIRSGDTIEYCFEISILDTVQTFILEQENPPSFTVR